MFKKRIVFLTLLFVSCSLSIHTNNIGYNVHEPSIAVASVSKNGYCGGVWIAEDKVMTAEHCIDNAKMQNNIYITNGDVKDTTSVIARDPFLDLAILQTTIKTKRWASMSDPVLNEELTVVMPPGVSVKTKVVKIDDMWGQAQLDWIAPNGASGSPAYNSKGELVCIMTKRIPEIGSYCNLVNKFGMVK
jgi:hypothetical protein